MTQTFNIQARLPLLLAIFILPVAVFFSVNSALAVSGSGVSEAQTLSEDLVVVPKAEAGGIQCAKKSVSASDPLLLAGGSTKVRCCCQEVDGKFVNCSSTAPGIKCDKNSGFKSKKSCFCEITPCT